MSAILYRGARVADGLADEPLDGVDILVVDRRIAEIGPRLTAPALDGLRTIDLDGNVLDVIDRAWNGRAPDSGSSPPVMSADGRTVAFASEATNLFATPSSGYFVYVHTRA